MKHSILGTFVSFGLIAWFGLLTACGGGGGGGDSGTPVDTSPPTVTSTSPANGATGVAPTSSVKITFNEAIDTTTLTGLTCTIKTASNTPVSFSITYADNVATLTPTGGLAYNTAYAVTIGKNVKDLSGNTMVSDYVFSFSTGAEVDVTPPVVVSTAPDKNATDVPADMAIVVNFSEAIDTSSITASTFTLKDGGNNILVGTLSHTDVAIIFTPDTELAYSTSYSATVAAGVADLSGNLMASDYSFSFATGTAPDVIAPVVTDTSPAQGASGIQVSTTVTITFSEPMAPSSINTGTFTLKNGSTPVVGTVSYQGLTATFTPSSQLANATTYTAEISLDATDLSGNGLASGVVWNFTTVSPPGPTTRVYAIKLNTLPSSVYTFNTTTPTQQTLLGSGTVPYPVYALDFNLDGSILYGMDSWNGLGIVDQVTGEYTYLGPVSGILANHNTDGLATDLQTGTIYIVSSHGFSSTTALYTLNPTTLTATLVGTQAVASYLVDLAFDSAGNLYTVSLGTDSLYKIDKQTGQLTLIGPLGQDIIGQQALTYDPSTDTLYGIIGNRDQVNYAFGTLNRTTGAFTPLAPNFGIMKIAAER